MSLKFAILILITRLSVITCGKPSFIGQELCRNLTEAVPYLTDPGSPPIDAWMQGRNRNIDIDIMFCPLAFVGINDVDQVFSLQAKVLFEWSLPENWIPDDFRNSSGYISGVPVHCRFKKDEIWRPSVDHLNKIGLGSPFKSGGNDFVAVSPFGFSATWEVTGQFDSSCTLNFAKFPFDIQNCSIVIGVVGNWNVEQQLKSDSWLLGQCFNRAMSGNTGTWRFLDFAQEDAVEATSLAMVAKAFKLTLQRTPECYVTNVFLPMALVVLLQLSIFVLPAEMAERSGLSMTAFLASSLLLGVLGDSLPITREVVYLAVNFAVQTAIGVVITFYALVTCRLARNSDSFFVKTRIRGITLANLVDMVAFLTSLAAYAIVNIYCFSKMTS